MFKNKAEKEKIKKPFGDTAFGQFFKKAAAVLPELGDIAFDFIGGPYEMAYDKLRDVIKDSNSAQAPGLLREMSEKERAFKLELEGVNLEYYKTDHLDRNRATRREVAYVKAGRFDFEKSFVLFSGLAVTGLVVYAIIFIQVPESNRDLFVALVGLVEGSILTQSFNYFFGSSRGSDQKTQLLRDK